MTKHEREFNKIEQLFNRLIATKPDKFPSEKKLKITCEHGVYIVYNKQKLVAHVGRTIRGKNGLCQRLNNHIESNSSFAKNYLQKNNLSVRDGFSFCFIAVEDSRQRVLLESYTSGRLCPLHVGTGINAEE